MAIPASLLGNAELGARLTSLILGIASLYFFWLCARELFDETAANYSTIVFAFYSLHIGYSTTSSSEVPYLFFLLGGMFWFFGFRRTHDNWKLLLSGVTMTCASAIRYEAWLIIFAMGLVLLWPITELVRPLFWRRDRLFPLAIFGVSAGAWPGFFMTYCWLKFRDPVHYLTMQKRWVAETGAFANHSILYVLAFHPGVMLITLSPFAIAAILYGVWLARREISPVRDYLVISLIFATVQFYELVSGGAWPSARFTMTLGTLLALSTGYGFVRLLPHIPIRVRTVTAVVFVAALALNLGFIIILSEVQWRFIENFRSVSPLVPFPLHIEQVARFLKPKVDSDSSLMIDNYNCESRTLAKAIGLPLLAGDQTFMASARIHSDTCDSSGSFYNYDAVKEVREVRDFLTVRRPKYVVYYDSGTLRPYLPLGTGCRSSIEVYGARFLCVFAGDIYRVYEVDY